jgi:hypothetical protein
MIDHEGFPQMRLFKLTGWLCALIVIATISGTARAAEPRPWLCRDKPVFSTSGPAHIDMTSHDSRRWQVFLMKFDPAGGHDGFTITNSYELGPGRGHASDNLDAGQFFAVALYSSSGHWICPGPANETDAPGSLSNLCYSTSGGSCDVSLTVKSAK